VLEHKSEYGSQWTAIGSMAAKIGCTAETLRRWDRQAERDPRQGQRVFCPGGARPPVQAMTAFIDEHRDVYGVEPICRLLEIAPSTHHDHCARRADPDLRSNRSPRKAALCPETSRIGQGNFGVYGACKVWRQLVREGYRVARCTVERLMRRLGLAGIVRGKALRPKPTGSSAPSGRTSCALPTSPTSRPARASSTSPS